MNSAFVDREEISTGIPYTVVRRTGIKWPLM